jgi:hypothetical protein
MTSAGSTMGETPGTGVEWGPLTEILLGSVSLRAAQQIEWEGPTVVAKNCPQAAQLIRRQEPSGWALS